MRCTPDTPPGPLIRVQNGQVTQIERRMASEQEMLARLHRASLETVRDYYHLPPTLLAPPPSNGRAGWVDFLVLQDPTLRADGWRLEIESDFPCLVNGPDRDGSLRVHDPGGGLGF